METISSFNALIQKAIVDNWNEDALTDYQGITLQYHDVARKIEKVHILFENSGVVKGDKIAICGRNSAHWAVAFLATLTYGAVAVPILHEFNGEQIQNIVNHSGSKLLFIGDFAVKTIDPEAMPDLEAIINIPDFSLMLSRSEKVTYAREHLNMMFGSKYPKAFRAEHVDYHIDDPEELALINYTSGTTGHSKGVMLPYRTIWSNVEFIMRILGRNVKAGDSVGYSRRTILDKDSVIAAIPIGYADGLNRHLGNRKGYCLVNGKKAEYVGNICMDVCMIDVTGIDCKEGDSVEIFGNNLPITELSERLDTIPYEMLTGVSNRVKRVYFEE